MAKTTRRNAATTRPNRRVAKADERVVKPTGRSVPVAPARRGGKPDHPTIPAAIDRRKHFSGTDEPVRRDR